ERFLPKLSLSTLRVIRQYRVTLKVLSLFSRRSDASHKSEQRQVKKRACQGTCHRVPPCNRNVRPLSPAEMLPVRTQPSDKTTCEPRSEEPAAVRPVFLICGRHRRYFTACPSPQRLQNRGVDIRIQSMLS